MNKKNKILVGCLALLLALSVGYALFSDTITIHGTATAKGEFKLTTICDMDVEASLGGMDNAELGSVTDAVITCNDNTVNASATLGYPGSHKYFRVMVENIGTIPAKLNSVVELNNPEYSFFTKDEGWSGYAIENCQGIRYANMACATLFAGYNWLDDYSVSNDGYGYDMAWVDDQFDAVLDPGETAYFFVYMNWASHSTTPGEPLTPTLNAEINWKQVTD